MATAFPIKLPSRGVVEASSTLLVQHPEGDAPALAEVIDLPVLPTLVVLSSRIDDVKPYIDVVDGHGHIVVAHGVTVYDDGHVFTAPLVRLFCEYCGDAIESGEVPKGTYKLEWKDEPQEGFLVGWSRVNGNSRYGYEPYHMRCL